MVGLSILTLWIYESKSGDFKNGMVSHPSKNCRRWSVGSVGRCAFIFTLHHLDVHPWNHWTRHASPAISMPCSPVPDFSPLAGRMSSYDDCIQSPCWATTTSIVTSRVAGCQCLKPLMAHACLPGQYNHAASTTPWSVANISSFSWRQKTIYKPATSKLQNTYKPVINQLQTTDKPDIAT